MHLLHIPKWSGGARKGAPAGCPGTVLELIENLEQHDAVVEPQLDSRGSTAVAQPPASTIVRAIAIARQLIATVACWAVHARGLRTTLIE